MALSRTFFWMLASLMVLVTISIISAFSAANVVAGSKVASVTTAVTANQLKPNECVGLSLVNVVYVTPGVPLVTTGNSSDLILGTNIVDDITARQGDDCIVGGGGDDIIDGNQGNDVILGGPGNDQLNGNNGNDTLYGGPGDDDLDGGPLADTCSGGGQAGDVFNRCETIVP